MQTNYQYTLQYAYKRLVGLYAYGKPLLDTSHIKSTQKYNIITTRGGVNVFVVPYVVTYIGKKRASKYNSGQWKNFFILNNNDRE